MTNPFESIEFRLSNIESLLHDLKLSGNRIHHDSEADELFTVQDAARFLSLSVPTIYGLISKKELPVMKRSKRCYFSKIELINYLKQGRSKTQSEIGLQAEAYLKGKM